MFRALHLIAAHRLDTRLRASHHCCMGIERARRAVVVRAGSDVGTPLGSSGRARLKILNQPGDDAGYALLEASHPAGEPRIRDHVHTRHEETFVVLAGQYEVRLGDDIVVARAGDFVFIPRGTPHTYRNGGSTPARVLNIISPPDGVELLADLGALAQVDVDEDALVELHARHNAILVNPLPNW